MDVGQAIDGLRALVLDGDELFVANDVRNVVTKISIPKKTAKNIASDVNRPHDLAVSKTYVYYTTSPSNAPGEIVRVLR